MGNSPDLVIEGKTKRVLRTDDPTRVRLVSKDDITAGDGKKHDVIPGKGERANQTTCNVLRLLKDCRIPTAFIEQDSPNSFIASACAMLPYEVVVRREAHGSYLRRAPHLRKGHLFPKLKLEFFLKTTGKKWKEYDLPCDDPLMVHVREDEIIRLYDPKHPDLAQAPAVPFIALNEDEVFTQENEVELMEQMGHIACRTFLVLEKAWQLLNKTLFDFKLEFGIGPNGELLLADVVDNDSWRLGSNGEDVSKQAYREGAELSDVARKYHYVADLTNRFGLPHQQLIMWCGSDKDDVSAFGDVLVKLFPNESRFGLRLPFSVTKIILSAHKKPARAYRELQLATQAIPDSVIVSNIGMSNGAGPTLSANTLAPTITVPVNWKEFPDDVWSSLRTPSNVPVMTILNPANAMLAALQILAMRNPYIYSVLRMELEKRLDDI